MNEGRGEGGREGGIDSGINQPANQPTNQPGVLTIYIGKPEIAAGKSNGSRHSVREASENMGCDLHVA